MRKNSLFAAVLATAALCFVGCSDSNQQQVDLLTQQLDSMKQENAKKDGDIQDMMSYVGVLADGLDSIAKQEQMLFYSNKGPEGTIVDRNQLKKNLDTFGTMLANQKIRIVQLSASLKSRGDSISKLYTLVSYLNQQLEEKDFQIQSLRADLERKDIDINQLRQRVSLLTDANTQLNIKVDRQADVLNKQDKLLNEAYVKIGTKKELSDLGLLSGGFLKKKKLDTEAIQKSMFTKVDIRKVTELTINSAKPKIITQMPASSYKIEKKDKNTSVLYILDPEAFWGVSNYLVIQTI